MSILTSPELTVLNQISQSGQNYTKHPKLNKGVQQIHTQITKTSKITPQSVIHNKHDKNNTTEALYNR